MSRAAAAALAALLLASCLVPVLEIHGGGTGGAAGAGGGFAPVGCDALFLATGWPEDCAACVAEAPCCAGVAESCGQDPACVDAARCLGQDPSPARPAACNAEHPSGYPLFTSTALECALEHCLDRCFGESWGCAGDWSPPPGPLPEDGQLFPVTVRLFDRKTFVPIGGAASSACAVGDRACAPPAASTETTVEGGAVFFLPLPFSGYFEVSADGHYPWRLFVPGFYEPLDLPIHLPDSATLDEVAITATGAAPLPDKVHVLARVTDCLQFRAPDVRIEVEGKPGVHAIYLSDGFVPGGAGATVADVSLEVGAEALLLNLPPASTYVVVARRAGKEVARSTLYLPSSAAGLFSYVLLEPTRL